jgi:DNA-directed RNA polymerase subunit RPC12/RpoP
MEVLFVCTYCNFKWTKKVYSASDTDIKCLKCDDKNLIVKELAKTKIDTYIGCPPFEEKKETKESLEDSGCYPFYFGGD